MEFRDYLRIAGRRWLLIAACFAITVSISAVLTFRATPLYLSTSQLFISTPGNDTAQAYQGSLFSAQRVTSYADLATNLRVAEEVIENVDTGLSPSELAESVTATAVPETVILELTVSHADPDDAQMYAQAYAEVMANFITELERPNGGGAAPIKATIAETATLPSVPYSPEPIRNFGLAALLGLVLGFGAAVLREVIDTSIKSTADVTSVTDVAVMGTIALDPNASKKPPISDIGTHAPRAEAFRVLRTNLQFADVDKPSKIFTVTSSIPGEGKTSTAMNLGIALAQGHERTLLIDADLRRPQIHERLGLEGSVGLTTVLLGRLDVSSAIQRHTRSGLHVLTSGATPPNPAELLQSQAMSDLLKSLRDEYDTIVLDAPPLLPVTDAALLASQSDGALLVVRHGRTSRDQLFHSLERLGAVDARAVGVVLNMAPVRRRGSSYGYADGYGYGYGYGPDHTKGRRRAVRGGGGPNVKPSDPNS